MSQKLIKISKLNVVISSFADLQSSETKILNEINTQQLTGMLQVMTFLKYQRSSENHRK